MPPAAAEGDSVTPAAGTPSPASPAPGPVEDSAVLDFANGLYARKMYGPAIEEYRKYLAAYPASPQAASALFRSADSLYFLKDYQAAIVKFEEFLAAYAADRRSGMARLRIGSAQFALKRPSQAVASLSDLASEAGGEPEVRAAALYYLAKSYQSMGLTGRAIRQFLDLCRDFSKTEYASYAAIEMGDHHRAAGRYKAAERAYRIASANAEPAELCRIGLYRLGEVLYALKDPAAARSRYLAALEAFAAAGPLTPQEEAMRQNALLGIFYCDLTLGDLQSAQKDATGALASLIDVSPNEAEILYLLAALHARQGQVDAALKLTDIALARGGLKPEALKNAALLKAQLLSERGDQEGALQVLLSLPADIPDLPRVNYEKAELFRLTGRDEEAIVHYRAVVDGYPDSSYAKAAYYQAGLLYLRAGHPDSARRMFGFFVAKYPADPIAEKAALELVQIDLDAGNYEEAEKGAQAALAAHPSGAHRDIALYKLAIAQAALGRTPEAAANFLRIAQEHPDSLIYREALYGAATSFEAAGQLKPALMSYEKMLASDAQDDDARHVLARLGPLYMDIGELDKAAELYLNLLTQRTDVEFSQEQAFWLIQYLLDNARYEPMQKALAAIPERFKDSDLTHETEFFLGESSMGLKRFPEAVVHYRKAVSIKPDGRFAPHAYLGVGLASAAQGDGAAAEAAYNEALKYDQEIRIAMRARYEIAGLRYREDTMLEAAKAYMMVAILYDDAVYTPMSLYRAGECFARAEMIDESRKAFEEVRLRYPESEWARKLAAQDKGGSAR